MNRKHFLSLFTGAGIVGSIPSRAENPDPVPPVIPRYLKPGDVIGITSPAGYITVEDIQPAIQQIKEWGLKVKIGASIGRRYFGFGGTDEERYRDMQRMLDDDSIQAIMCARGGYGVVRIIDRLNFEKFVRKPKWIIGFSDVTILHAHINSRYNIASIHSKMCNSFPKDWNKALDVQRQTIFSIRDALMGKRSEFSFSSSPANRQGIAEGVLVGGNLKLLETLAGTASDLNTTDKILFLEDTGEYLYSIDRMLWNLKRTHKIARLKGLVLGGFKIKPDDPGEEFGIALEEIVMSKMRDYSFPVCFNFPVGHQPNNFALKCGVRYRLNVQQSTCLLEEII